MRIVTFIITMCFLALIASSLFRVLCRALKNGKVYIGKKWLVDYKANGFEYIFFVALYSLACVFIMLCLVYATFGFFFKRQ